MIEESKKAIEDKAKKIESEAESQIKSLKEKASANMDKAVGRIIEEVLGVKP
jgi:vacuolar-type H+-ATPase subunit H